MKVLYEMINAKAGSTFNQPITTENYNTYCQHWIWIARTLQREFDALGLIDTVKYLNSMIEDQQKFLK